MFLNGEPVNTACGLLFVGKYKRKWCIVAKRRNANLLSRGPRWMAEKILAEYGVNIDELEQRIEGRFFP